MGPRRRRGDAELRGTASDWTPSLLMVGAGTGPDYAATATSSGMFLVLIRLRNTHRLQP